MKCNESVVEPYGRFMKVFETWLVYRFRLSLWQNGVCGLAGVVVDSMPSDWVILRLLLLFYLY